MTINPAKTAEQNEMLFWSVHVNFGWATAGTMC